MGCPSIILLDHALDSRIRVVEVYTVPIVWFAESDIQMAWEVEGRGEGSDTVFIGTVNWDRAIEVERNETLSVHCVQIGICVAEFT